MIGVTLEIYGPEYPETLKLWAVPVGIWFLIYQGTDLDEFDAGLVTVGVTFALMVVGFFSFAALSIPLGGS